MEYLVPFLSTFFGSAGLVSVITAVINRSRQSAARRFLDDAKAAKDVAGLDPHAEAVLDQAVATTTLRLASSAFWFRSAGERLGIFVGVLVTGLLIAMVFAAAVVKIMQSPWEVDTALNVIAVLVAFAIYVGIGVAVVVYGERRSREVQFYPELLRIPIVVETAEIRRARHARRRRRLAMEKTGRWMDRRWNRARRAVTASRASRSEAGPQAHQEPARVPEEEIA